jgi:hypothetical protein
MRAPLAPPATAHGAFSRRGGPRISFRGIVNLDGRGMLVVSVAQRLGSDGPLLADCAVPLQSSGPQKGAPGPLS